MKKFSIIFILVLLVSSCGEEKFKPTVDASVKGDEIPVQESWDTQIIFSEDGKTKAVLHADHIRTYEDKRIKLLDGVKIEFYDDDEKVSSTLTSKRGRINDLTDDMFAIDSVVAVSDSGVTLRTEELIWKNKTKKIKTDKFVTIINGKEKIQGYGFESDQNLKNYTIYNITYVTTIKEK
ncbi:lipopolysaccharide-assembly, LptC-related [bacterium BMS3Abin04]|nr:lipopolysaccharide-assembly, LptC-related [bacterium BMS3Abin04]